MSLTMISMKFPLFTTTELAGILRKLGFNEYYTLKKEKELKFTSLLPILHHIQSTFPFL
jgi:hypothetical protein